MYCGDDFALFSPAATLLSFSNGDAGEFCDEVGTACEFGSELLSGTISRLFGMIGDDVFCVGDIDGDRFNPLF